MKVLVFDTETTGLPTERNAPINETHKFPHIMQLSYILYDTEWRETVIVRDDYIKVADTVIISEGSVAIHGITREISVQRGIPLEEALARFNAHVLMADVIVAHNLAFDKTMIGVECVRLNLESPFTNKDEHCTMLQNIETCKLPNKSSYNKNNSYKWPTLAELHKHCFASVPQGLHNALTDVRACLRCYLYLNHQYDMDKVI